MHAPARHKWDEVVAQRTQRAAPGRALPALAHQSAPVRPHSCCPQRHQRKVVKNKKRVPDGTS